jgi:hypothetical protein
MTAVEWLAEHLCNEMNFDYWKAVEKAKEMEIKQAHEYAEFAIRCDRKDMKILNFDGYINLENNKK